jgi:hypothetical protein
MIIAVQFLEWSLYVNKLRIFLYFYPLVDDLQACESDQNQNEVACVRS